MEGTTNGNGFPGLREAKPISSSRPRRNRRRRRRGADEPFGEVLTFFQQRSLSFIVSADLRRRRVSSSAEPKFAAANTFLWRRDPEFACDGSYRPVTAPGSPASADIGLSRLTTTVADPAIKGSGPVTTSRSLSG